MIFRQWQQVLDGTKTQTRRAVKPGQFESGRQVIGGYLQHTAETTSIRYQSAINRPVRDLYRVGNSYAVVPKRCESSVGRIKICSLRAEFLQEITEADARSEGVESVEAYRQLWGSINGKTKGARWEDNPFVWVITFECVTGHHEDRHRS